MTNEIWKGFWSTFSTLFIAHQEWLLFNLLCLNFNLSLYFKIVFKLLKITPFSNIRSVPKTNKCKVRFKNLKIVWFSYAFLSMFFEHSQILFLTFQLPLSIYFLSGLSNVFKERECERKKPNYIGSKKELSKCDKAKY